MSAEFLWPAFVTLLSLLVYTVFTGLVGSARGKFNVPAPATAGHPDFERRLRVQANTLEQLVSFVPALWIFSLGVSPKWGAALGGVWIVGRIVYAIGYYQAAAKRGVGFAITQVATASLLLGSLVGVGLKIVKGL
jgi:glutathione S-transferase